MKPPYGLTQEEVRAIRVAWALFDDARDRDLQGLAREILKGLERKARELGLKSADDLANL